MDRPREETHAERLALALTPGYALRRSALLFVAIVASSEGGRRAVPANSSAVKAACATKHPG
jgi:hypothetical protein